ncbi:MAG: exported protein of unknown function [Phycisphaerales bacterium]|nr:exported protein of unknown function [Phycisphaerales bacterium]
MHQLPERVTKQRARNASRRSTTPRLTSGALVALGVLAVRPVLGDDYFIGTAGGDWGTASNWSNNTKPVSNESAYLGYDFGNVVFANPSSLTVTFSGPAEQFLQSVNSKTNLQIFAAASFNTPIMKVQGSQFTIDPSASLSLGVQSGTTFSSASLRIAPAAGTAFILNANISEGAFGGIALGTQSAQPSSVTYGAGYVWNISSPNAANGNNTTPTNLDSLYAPLVLNGTVNLSSGATAVMGSAGMAGTATTLTIGTTGKLATSVGSFDAGSTNNQGAIALSGTGASSVSSNFINGGSFSVSGGATFGQGTLTGTNVTTNTGSISIDGAGSKAVLVNLAGAGSVSVAHGGELDLDSFDNSLLDHVSFDSTAKFVLGGTVTTAAGNTFDFTRLGSHVTFGSNFANDSVSFDGGSIAHSDQLSNVAQLTNVSLDHGLTVNLNGFATTAQVNGTVSAGDQPVTLTSAVRFIIADGATLNGDVKFVQAGNGVGGATFTLGGTLNGNIIVNTPAQLNLGAGAHATSTITINSGGALVVGANNGALLSGSNLNLAAASLLSISNFSFNAGSSITLPGGEVNVFGPWTNAGTMTISDGAFFIPNVGHVTPITNSGTMSLAAGAQFSGWPQSQFIPILNSGTFTVSGHWQDQTSAERTVSNSGALTINSTAEVDQWEYSQSAGKTLVNGLLYFVQDGNSNPLGSAGLTGGTLAGTGTIRRYALSATGGTMLGGDVGTPGTMSFVDSTLTLGQSATLESQILSSTQYGALAFSGSGDTVSLGGTLKVDLLPGATYPYGQVFTLITADSITGTFSTLNLPAGWQVTYTVTTVSISAVPEPAALGLLAAITVGVWGRCRRRT